MYIITVFLNFFEFYPNKAIYNEGLGGIQRDRQDGMGENGIELMVKTSWVRVFVPFCIWVVVLLSNPVYGQFSNGWINFTQTY